MCRKLGNGAYFALEGLESEFDLVIEGYCHHEDRLPNRIGRQP